MSFSHYILCILSNQACSQRKEIENSDQENAQTTGTKTTRKKDTFRTN